MGQVGRNAPCPCGSGKKHKACCGKDEPRSGARGTRLLAVLIGLAVVGGVAIAIGKLGETTTTPQPWEYDAANNRHWNPLPDHQHWHDGPPPSGTGRQPVDSGATAAIPAAPPAPATAPPADPAAVADGGDGETPGDWEYDAEQDRHWNPETGRWEAGMPPFDAFVSEP